MRKNNIEIEENTRVIIHYNLRNINILYICVFYFILYFSISFNFFSCATKQEMIQIIEGKKREMLKNPKIVFQTNIDLSIFKVQENYLNNLLPNLDNLMIKLSVSNNCIDNIYYTFSEFNPTEDENRFVIELDRIYTNIKGKFELIRIESNQNRFVFNQLISNDINRYPNYLLKSIELKLGPKNFLDTSLSFNSYSLTNIFTYNNGYERYKVFLEIYLTKNRIVNVSFSNLVFINSNLNDWRHVYIRDPLKK